MAATESYGHAAGFSLVRHVLDDNRATDRYAALLDVHQKNQSTDQTKLHTVVTKATIDEIRKAKGFEQFADPTDMSAWSNIQAVLVRNGGTITLNNADISVETANDIKTRNFDAVGINNIGGTLTLTGDRTNIVVKQNAQYDTLGAETDISAVGYLAIDTIATKDTATVTNFNAAKTSFDITNTVKDQAAAGIISAANDTSRPQINVAGDLDITARSATGGTSIGLLNAYSDWNLETDPPINNPGHIKVNKNLTVDVTGGLNAFGLSSEIGDVIVDGSTYITAKVTDTKPAPQEQGDSIHNPRPEAGAYGIYVTSNGHVTLNGKETVVTADKALVITKQSTIFDIDVNGQEWVPNTLDTSVSILSKTTTLNGTTSTEEGTKLYVANTVNFNGDADIQGLIMANADATLKIADGKKLTFGDSKTDASNTFKNLTLAGGTFSNASQMTVDGTLTLNGVELINKSEEGKKTAEIDVTGAGKVVFGNGTKVTNYGGLHAKHYKLETGSLYLEEDDEFTISGDKLATTFSEDILELAGGKLSNIGDGENGKAELALSGIHLVGKDGSANDGVIMVSNGTYDFDAVTVDIAPQGTGPASARLMVTGDNAVLNVGTFNAAQGSASIADDGTFKVTSLNASGAFEIDAQTAKSFNVATFKGADGGDFKLSGGTMNVTAIDLAAGKLTIGGSSSLVTASDQVFVHGLGSKGTVKDAGGLRYGDRLVFEDNSSLTLNDAFYNFDFVASAKSALNASSKDMTVVFSGKLVDEEGNTRDEIGIDSVTEDAVLEQTDIAAKGDETGTVTIDKSFGGQTLVVDSGSTVAVEAGKTLTLAGGADASGELINFKDAEGDKTVTAAGANGGLALGTTTKATQGQISAKVELTQQATLTSKNGTFTVKDVIAKDANIKVESGSLTVEKLAVSGETTIASNKLGATKVTELTVSKKDAQGSDNKIEITGVVSADKIIVAEGAEATIHIGKAEADAREGEVAAANGRGDLTIADAEKSLKGLTFFLDPTWVDGQEVTGASRLVMNKTAVDANIIVGHNSYVVLGSTDDAAFVNLFSDGSLKWGDGEGETLAAAYAAKPISITDGYLVVDGSLKTLPTTDLPTAGSVKFGANTVFVADLTDADADTPMITKGENGTYTIDSTSKAVVVGDIKNGVSYKLTDDADADYWNTADTLVSGNPLWGFELNDDGSFTANLKDAGVVFGDLLQGHEIANAGMTSDDAGVRSYVGKLLTDELDNVQHAVLAARFDAAMNTAGAAAVFTTAYDRASELRDAVRGEALEGEGNRLWAQVTGGKTKLKGLSSGAQPVHVDTDAYGLVVGGDVALSNGVLGAAFTAGTGDSENDDVGVKDDFDFYGLSVYGKTSVGGIDLLADGSMTFVKSDLTMGGVADVDTDTTTAVYSLGVQAQRTWDYVVEITPFIGMDIYHVRGDGYDNGHGAQVDDAHATAVEFPIGATIAKAFETNGFKLSPNFSFAVVPTVGDRDIDSKVRFAGAQSTYNFTFADDVKVRTNLGFAAEKDNFRFGLNAGYDWGNEERSATKLMLNAQYRF